MELALGAGARAAPDRTARGSRQRADPSGQQLCRRHARSRRSAAGHQRRDLARPSPLSRRVLRAHLHLPHRAQPRDRLHHATTTPDPGCRGRECHGRQPTESRRNALGRATGSAAARHDTAAALESPAGRHIDARGPQLQRDCRRARHLRNQCRCASDARTSRCCVRGSEG